MSEKWHPPQPSVLEMLQNLQNAVRMDFGREPWAEFVTWDAQMMESHPEEQRRFRQTFRGPEFARSPYWRGQDSKFVPSLYGPLHANHFYRAFGGWGSSSSGDSCGGPSGSPHSLLPCSWIEPPPGALALLEALKAG